MVGFTERHWVAKALTRFPVKAVAYTRCTRYLAHEITCYTISYGNYRSRNYQPKINKDRAITTNFQRICLAPVKVWFSKNSGESNNNNTKHKTKVGDCKGNRKTNSYNWGVVKMFVGLETNLDQERPD